MNAWKWSEKELQTLADLYPSEGPKGVAKITGRSLEAIRSKAKELKIKVLTMHGRFRGPVIKWTEEEINAIQKYYLERGSIYIVNMFPHRTKQAVQQEACKRGIARIALLRPRKANKISMPNKYVKNNGKGGELAVIQRTIPVGQWVSDIPKVRSVFDLGGCV